MKSCSAKITSVSLVMSREGFVGAFRMSIRQSLNATGRATEATTDNDTIQADDTQSDESSFTKQHQLCAEMAFLIATIGLKTSG